MVVVMQTVCIHPGKESVFEMFENVAIRLIGKHGGELLLRLRPTKDSMIEGSLEVPYEIHLVRFPSETALAAFSADPERQAVLHLKNEAVRSSLIVQSAPI
jgi:uncharacterized protein (DUF1330 family)